MIDFGFYCKGLAIKHYPLLLTLMLTCLVTTPISAIEVVTHAQVTDSSLTKSQLRRIYTMRQLHWSDNSAITVFVLPSQHSLHQRFAKEHLQMFPYQLNRIWHKLTYSGMGVAPIVVNSESELIQIIMNTPGSIGYINDNTLNIFKENLNHTAVTATSQKKTIDIKVETGSKGVVNVVQIKG